jgi:DNA-binding LacI/PurR family transcriptional regulator/signal transduction histidine kinase
MATTRARRRDGASLTVGILIAGFGDTYSTPTISGVANVMRERGVNVICFAGGQPRSPQAKGGGGGALYELIGPESVDGLVLISGTLVHSLGPEPLEKFVERYADLPRVSIAVDLPSCPSVLVDDEKGLRDALAHLVDAHAYRRIAFIRGPLQNTDAENRFRIFKQFMAERGLAVDPSWIAPGAFDWASGQLAVEILFAERKVAVDAVVAANDQMALGAIEALKGRGIGVPEQLAVIGFDDIDMSTFVMPPLTTVRQPLNLLGARAAANLLAQLRGEAARETVILPTEAVIRESCGCSHEAHVITSQIERRAQAHRHLLAERSARTLSQISQALISTIDLQELADVVGQGMQALDVKSCYLSLYDDPQGGTEWSRLVLLPDGNGGVRLASGNLRFPSRELVPGGMLAASRQLTMVVEPLDFNEEQLGFVVFEADRYDGTLYAELRQQLSSAIMRVRREEELARLHQAERERASELEQAYRAMKENQEKLLISEKMAALGRLTAGMAHEMNTPLAAVRMALEELGKLSKEYETSLSDAQVTPEDHAEIAKEMSASIRLATNAAEKVAGFVHGIKAQTRDLSSKDFRRFNAVPVIRDTLLLLNHSLGKNGCTISFEHSSEVLDVHGAPGRLAQVVTNLVTNAIDASRSKGGGPIVLSLSSNSSNESAIKLKIADKGGGIPADIMKRIFDPMFTTKPFGEGTGLGLSIVHDIVSTDFNGTIEVESEVGQGTTFTLNLVSTGPLDRAR